MAVSSSSDCVYAKGSLLGSDKDWYHGQLTRVQAEQALKASGYDCFLIRESVKGGLVLTLIHDKRFCNIKIKCGPGWYKLDLESVEKSFPEVDELVSYYQRHNISDELETTLGEVCEKSSTDVPFDLTPSVYAKGSLLGSDKDWYHGQLTRVEAEQALTASGCDCFLIRENRGALILSLIHHGQVHHVNIKYGPGWYELESGSAQYSFTELDALVSHYGIEHISDDLKLTLGVACEKTRTKGTSEINSDLYMLEHHYESIQDRDIYSKGKPSDLTKYKWYHGNITEEQAEIVLGTAYYNTFLVRYSDNNLILSKRINGWKSHDIIHRSPEGYRLEGKEKVFKSVPKLLIHYKHYPIDERNMQVLGNPIVKKFSDLNITTPPAVVFKKSEKLLKINHWRRCADLPVGVSTSPIVKIGDAVYVGDGVRAASAEASIFKFNIPSGTWSHLPDCPTHQHGLTTLNGELIVIGGRRSFGRVTNIVVTFRDDRWQEVLPPMPTPRFSLSTISDNRLIIAAGGATTVKSNGEFLNTDIVEMYIPDIKDDCWHRTKRLPFPISTFSTCTIHNAYCFILGGVGKHYDHSYTSPCTTITSLLGHAIPVADKRPIPHISKTWEALEDKHPLIFPSLVELDGRLLAMGGSADSERSLGTKFISTYDFVNNTWVECKGAELPLPLYRPGLLNLGNNEVMLIGGEPRSQQFSAAVFIGSYENC